MIKKTLLAAAAIAAMATAAEAGCSKANLKGTWAAAVGPTAFPVTNLNGTVPVVTAISPISTLTIGSFGSNCKGSGVVKAFTGGITLSIPALLVSDVVTGTAKPNMLTAKFPFSGIEYIINLSRIQ
jgi:L-serine deaminase